MPLAAIATKKKSMEVAEQLMEEIRQGTYKVGDKLPTEREIAIETQVSRTSVREALSALHIACIVESRVGDGTYVIRYPTESELAPGEDSEIGTIEGLEEVYQARHILEKSIAELACDTAEDDDIQHIHEELSGLADAVKTQDHSFFQEANRRFHQAIANATGNSLLISTLDHYLNVMANHLPTDIKERYEQRDPNRFDRAYELHTQIYDAISSRDKEQTVIAINEHFDVFTRNVSSSDYKGGDT